MNILISTGGLSVTGGAQYFILRITKYWMENGHLVKIFSLDEISSNQLKKMEKTFQYKFDIISHKNNWFEKILIKINFKLRLNKLTDAYIRNKNKNLFKKTLKSNNWNILNSHLIASDLFICSLSKKNITIPLVCIPHGEYNEGYMESNGIKLEKYVSKIIKFTNGVIYLTDLSLPTINKIKSYNKNIKFKKIYNGTSLDLEILDKKQFKKELMINEDSFVFIMVSRGEISKGWEETINAFLSFIERNKSVNSHLILIGSSEYLDSLKKKYDQNKLIKFMGYQNPINYLRISNCFVFPTYFSGEALPNVIAEALLCNLPVIATKYVEIPNMLKTPEGEAGFLIDFEKNTNKANIEQIINAMELYYFNPVIYENHKQNTIIASESFKMNICSEKYLKFFQELQLQ